MNEKTIIDVCTVIGTQLTNCQRYETGVFFGWYFESTNYACTFPSPLPKWLFEISPYVTNIILFALCGRIT